MQKRSEGGCDECSSCAGECASPRTEAANIMAQPSAIPNERASDGHNQQFAADQPQKEHNFFLPCCWITRPVGPAVHNAVWGRVVRMSDGLVSGQRPSVSAIKHRDRGHA